MFSPVMSLIVLILPASAAEAEPSEAATRELRERVRLLERAVDELRGTGDVVASEIPLDLETRFRAYTAVNLNYLEEYKVLSWNLDETVLQYTANLDRKMTANVEISFEPSEHGVDVGVESLELTLAPRPAFQMAVGQFHLPLSPWAVTASQGAYRYLPTAVPEVLEETPGEEFLPIDQTGLQLRGQVPVGFWQFRYAAGATNGRAPDPGASAQAFDFNNFKALLGRVALQSPGGFEVGVGGYHDLIDVHDETLLDGTEVDEEEEFAKKTVIDNAGETIAGASIGWQGGRVELQSEAYMVLHSLSGTTYSSLSGFVVVGVPIRRTTPFLMLDYVSVNPDDPVYQVFDRTGPELEVLPGFRYDIGLRLALKVQAEVAYELDSETIGWGLQSQLAAGF